MKKIVFYSAKTEQEARLYNCECRDVVFAQAIAGGADEGEAYYTIYLHGAKQKYTDLEQFRTAAKEFINSHPSIKIFIQRLKNKSRTAAGVNELRNVQEDQEAASRNTEDDEVVKKFADKSYIIAKLAETSKYLRGKEKAAVLMQIADLQRMKQEDVREEEETRVYYLPYISSCRTCKLMTLYKLLFNGKEANES